jgi:glycosyltransferase involved in cell wall biosynthesis/peptidoglycan/xylan/chitin deacetylase (PgdA/CDA1 family)
MGTTFASFLSAPLNVAYYSLKPYVPWSARIALRRWRAERRRRAFANVWPIDEKAGATPSGWPGWLAGKRFALILTHDVEGKKGLERVERLMKLDLRYGFRSAFNFVPEGDYCVSDELRQTLAQSGFEVGMHGLEHDGKLFSSKTGFARKAARIREYLQRWNARGFRAPLMQHRLGWLHRLGIEYDASTFDTDPFEPEPDGAETIFPFWVAGSNNTGYVELPYTMVQDFSLFVILHEPGIDIWRRKLDWIAERGGMALLITHPDYMCFEGPSRTREEYPVAHYEEFLRYVREKYEGAFWSATPLEVARYYCASVPPASRNSRKKICMLAYSSYESDNRVRRYAETLAKRGDHVDVIALGGKDAPLGKTELNGVSVYRIQRRQFDEHGMWSYAFPLLRFLWNSSFFLSRCHRRNRYDLIHVHNMPDFLVFAAWYPKWTGAKVILDIHDMVPELFVNKFRSKAGGACFKLMKTLEKASAAFVDHVIVSNHLWREKLILRSVPSEKCSVFLNHVDPSLFYRRPRTRSDGKFIIIFPGSFQRHQGLDIAIKAFARLKDKVPNAEFHLYGRADGMQAELAGLAYRLGLNGGVKFCGSLPLDQIASVMANSDLGVVPKRADSFGNEAYSTKIMEFMSQGVPVVVSRTKIDTFYFDDNVVRFFDSGNDQAMAEAILDVINHPDVREALVARGYDYVDRHSWNRKKGDYLDLVDSLSMEPMTDLALVKRPTIESLPEPAVRPGATVLIRRAAASNLMRTPAPTESMRSGG